ncbi:Tetratricopeptide repeat-containing protein [Roseateles sp. YR242]|uniref:tetratricopeptide repeat protein n=1 Tax=Roseateles sp. YR242 TaxID=1855305 RepID=UPI0008D12E61|nr:tetratricopeptide repeat protein [Roseateles sp. YR242]SEL70873.1 Tetratricopeptide repeat-containing protein [Roseateles sp. YR242]
MPASVRHPWWIPAALALSCAAHAQSVQPAAPAASAPPAAASAPPAAASAASAPEPISNSDLDAPMFYQLLIGEMALQNNEPEGAFQVLLDAARRAEDEELFRRVVAIALQARSGDRAVIAARAWRDTLPTSQEAHRTLIQLLALLNRPAEVAPPLRALLGMNAPDARANLLAGIPSLFARSPEPKKVQEALEPLLRETAARPETRFVSLMVLARLAQMAGNAETALVHVRAAAKDFPERDEPLLMALELLPQRPEAEALVTAELQAHPDKQSLRQAYARALARAQRPADAAREFRVLTKDAPENLTSWLALGSLELDLQHPDAAENALQRYMRLLDEQPAQRERLELGEREARQQGLLLLAQAAEMRGDLKSADTRLSQIDAAPGNIDIAYRRASLLARQGKLEQGRKLLQALPADQEQERRAKVMAESQLLRENRQWQAAYDVLGQAVAANGEEPDLLYEQSMMAEKLGKMKEMEALLQKVIQIKPQHYHAYNALGYALADRNERLEEARDLISKALTFAPGEPFIVDSMGWVEYRLGRMGEAERLLRQAYSSRPDPEIAAHLGEVLWAGGQKDEARRIFADAIKRDPENEAVKNTLQRLQVRP